MISGQDIICFGPTDWWSSNPSCTTHIMTELAKTNRVLYINPFSSDISGGIKKGIATRIVRKARSVLKCYRRAGENLSVYSPVFLPLQGHKRIDAMNNSALVNQLKSAMKLLGFSDPIVWIENVRAADLIAPLRSKLTIYHVSDLFSECKYTANKIKLREREAWVSKNADVLICVSKKLQAAKLQDRPDAAYIPHGVDFELFYRAAKRGNMHPGLKDIRKPVIGYYGSLTPNNDIDLLEYCASELSDCSFVLAGQITGGDYGALLSMDNVHYLGKQPYTSIPSLCAGFSVCLLPWRVTDWIRHCHPLKLCEYMASGKPIVSVTIDEVVENYSDLVSVGHDRKQFCDAIRYELDNDTPQRAARRKTIAKDRSWGRQIEKISDLIEDTMDAKTSDEEQMLCTGGSN